MEIQSLKNLKQIHPWLFQTPADEKSRQKSKKRKTSPEQEVDNEFVWLNYNLRVNGKQEQVLDKCLITRMGPWKPFVLKRCTMRESMRRPPLPMEGAGFHRPEDVPNGNNFFVRLQLIHEQLALAIGQLHLPTLQSLLLSTNLQILPPPLVQMVIDYYCLPILYIKIWLVRDPNAQWTLEELSIWKMHLSRSICVVDNKPNWGFGRLHGPVHFQVFTTKAEAGAAAWQPLDVIMPPEQVLVRILKCVLSSPL